MGKGPEDDNVLDDPLDDDDVGGALGDAPLVDEEVSSALSDEPLVDEGAGGSLSDAPTVDAEDDAEVSSALNDEPLVDEEVTSAFSDDDEPLVKRAPPRGLDVGRGLSASSLDDPDLMDEDFAPAEPIEDELLTSVGDVPLVDPVEHRAPADGSRGLTRALWFFGIVVTALAALQTAQMFVARPAVERVERPEPAETVAPVASQRNVAPPQPPPPPAGRTPAEAIDRTLLDSRVQLSRGLYEQVRRILEPLAEDPQLLDANQRFEAYLLLAKAHRALGNVEKAQQWSLKATDQAIDRREPAQVFEEASTLSGEGRHADARRVLHQLLARADALPEKEAEYRLKAQVRVADAWWGEAVRSGAFAPLPGLDAKTEPQDSKPKDAKHAEEKR